MLILKITFLIAGKIFMNIYKDIKNAYPEIMRYANSIIANRPKN